MRNLMPIQRFGNVGRHMATSGLCLSLAFILPLLIVERQAWGQDFASRLAPAATSLQGDNVVTAAVMMPQGSNSVSASLADYSILGDTTSVQPASAMSVGGYCPPDPCNAGCDINYYVSFDALLLTRDGDERFSLSRNTFLDEFEYELGGRFTVGTMLDCANGFEFVYAGPFDWFRTSTVTGGGNLQSQLQAVPGFTVADINSFNGANLHSQQWRSQLHSMEFNQRWFAWDVVSTLIGVRFIDYEEDYLFQTIHPTNGTGALADSVDNQMVGLQIGGELLYPVNLRTNVGIRGKAGLFANFSERQTNLVNNGTIQINAGESDVELAGLIECGIFSMYSLTRSVRLTAGYEAWYLPEAATVPEQSPGIIAPGSGTTVTGSDDLFIHGASVGVQVLY